MVPLCVKVCAEEPLNDNNTPNVLPSILPAFVALPVIFMVNNKVVLPIIFPDAPRLKVVVFIVVVPVVVIDPLFIVNPPLKVKVPPAALSFPPLIRTAPVTVVVGAVPNWKPPVPVFCIVTVPLTVVNVLEKVAATVCDGEFHRIFPAATAEAGQAGVVPTIPVILILDAAL